MKVKGDDRYLRLQTFDAKLEIATAGNTWGHPAAENAMGVGQVEVSDAGGAGGVFNGTEDVASSSSDGPRRVFFEPDGMAITTSTIPSKTALPPDRDSDDASRDKANAICLELRAS